MCFLFQTSGAFNNKFSFNVALRHYYLAVSHSLPRWGFPPPGRFTDSPRSAAEFETVRVEASPKGRAACGGFSFWKQLFSPSSARELHRLRPASGLHLWMALFCSVSVCSLYNQGSEARSEVLKLFRCFFLGDKVCFFLILTLGQPSHRQTLVLHLTWEPPKFSLLKKPQVNPK